MKSSSTRSGPSCSGFWDTVRNKTPTLTIVCNETFTCKNCGRVVICTRYPLLHPLSSRSSVQIVQSQNQPLKPHLIFIQWGENEPVSPANDTPDTTSLYHTSNIHQQFDSWQGYGQPIYISLRSRKPRLPTHNFLCQEGWHRPALSLFAKVSVCATTRRISGYCASAPASG